MDSDKLHEQLKIYQEMAKKDKSIDVASLMTQALEAKSGNYLPAGQRRMGYLVSVAAPPFGLIYALRFWFSGKDDGPEAAVACVVLTAVGVGAFVLIVNMMFSGSGVSPQQIQQINPNDIRSLVE